MDRNQNNYLMYEYFYYAAAMNKNNNKIYN